MEDDSHAHCADASVAVQRRVASTGFAFRAFPPRAGVVKSRNRQSTKLWLLPGKPARGPRNDTMVIPFCHSRQDARTRRYCHLAMPHVCRPSGPGRGGSTHRWLRHRQGLLRPSGPKAWKAFASIERTRPRARRPRAEGPSRRHNRCCKKSVSLSRCPSPSGFKHG